MPETPVTQVNVPSGKATSMFLQVVLRRAEDVQAFPVAAAAAVRDRDLFRAGQILPRDAARVGMISSTCPAATISPPWTPAPGPTSTMKSAARMVSSSCSTTMRVLPMSRRC